MKKIRTNFCPILFTLDRIGGRWRLPIIYTLHLRGTLRFSELAKAIEGVSPRMLARELQELEAYGLITRAVYAQVPPRVEYALTAQGTALQPLLEAMAAWGNTHARPRHAEAAM